MTSEVVQQAKALIKGSMLAAIAAQPLDPGLSEEELATLVVGREGIGPGSFLDAMATFRAGPKDARQRLLGPPRDLVEIMIESSAISEEIRPSAALNAVARAFDELENQKGQRASCDHVWLMARCASLAAGKVDHALALAVAWGRIEKRGERLARRGRRWPEYTPGRIVTQLSVSEVARHAALLLPIVREVFARRADAPKGAASTSDRFAEWLAEVGPPEVAGRWTEMAGELASLDVDLQPSAVCLLAGVLLESALLAKVEDAIRRGVWKVEPGAPPPPGWSLRELVAWSSAARVFGKEELELGEWLAAVSTRTHPAAVRQALPGLPPVKPSDATRARSALMTLLEAIATKLLAWPEEKKP
jgi:hypothetical protein